MVEPSLAFSAGNALALLSWLALSTSLFLPPPWRLGVWNGTTYRALAATPGTKD